MHTAGMCLGCLIHLNNYGTVLDLIPCFDLDTVGSEAELVQDVHSSMG